MFRVRDRERESEREREVRKKLTHVVYSLIFLPSSGCPFTTLIEQKN